MLRCSVTVTFEVLHNASRLAATAAAGHSPTGAVFWPGVWGSCKHGVKAGSAGVFGERVGQDEAAAQMPELVQAMARSQKLQTEKVPAGAPGIRTCIHVVFACCRCGRVIVDSCMQDTAWVSQKMVGACQLKRLLLQHKGSPTRSFLDATDGYLVNVPSTRTTQHTNRWNSRPTDKIIS